MMVMMIIATTNFLDGFGCSTLAIDEMRDAVNRQPGAFGGDEVGDKSEDGHTGHDDWGVWLERERESK